MRIEDSLPQIRAYAFRAHRRAFAMGATSLTLEDVMQELAIAWCIARDGYEPGRGAAFSTFLHRGMAQHMAGFLRSKLERCVGTDHSMVFLDAVSQTEDGDRQHQVPSDDPAPDEVLENRQTLQTILSRVSGRARLFLELLIETPADLAVEFAKVQARDEHGQHHGIGSSPRNDPVSVILFDLMGMTRFERDRTVKEIKMACV